MGSPWKTVSFSSVTPQLLMKTRFDRTGYDIQLTDLSRIWRETLSRKEIIKRAIESGCSFNPGDDDNNYDAFIRCIDRALNGEAKTTSNLLSSNVAQLLLDLSVPLPGGLSALEWTVELVQQPESAVATDIVGPLLLQANRMRGEIQQLVDEISSKDHVIQKITDKFETGGSDLTAVFPGASNVKTAKKRSQSQRSQLAAHVKGLAEFDQATWRASNEKLRGAQELTPEVMDMVMRDLPLIDRSDHGIDSWVENLANGSQGRSQVHIRPKSGSGKSKTPEPNTQDEGFERQETPPHLKKHTTAVNHAQVDGKAPQAGEDSETEDEDCLDIPPTTSQQQALSTIERSDSSDEGLNATKAMPDATPEVPRESSGLKGEPPQPGLGKETDVPTSPPPVFNSKKKPEINDTDSEVETEKKPRKTALGKFGGAKPKNDTRATERKEEAEEDEAETELEPVKPKSKLGKFGGKKVQPSGSTPESTPSVAPPSKPRSTLGRFGGRAKATTAAQPPKQEATDIEPNSSARVESTKPSATPSTRHLTDVEQAPEREMTEEEKQQRADEKREKLKRELEAKPTGPVKKKRKF